MSDMPSQRHYSQEDWVDFVRDATASGRHEAMQQHLAEGCESCRETHETWKAVLGTLRQEPNFEPPAGAMRLAKLVYAATKPQHRSTLEELAATLLFDSEHAVAAAGVRALRPGPRKLLYGNGEFLVDLQFEPSKNRAKTILTGQVMELDKAELHVAGLLVVLLQKRKLVARTNTNPFGEFIMEFDGPGDGLSLAIDINHKAMIIALNELTKVS
jgi:hypothetical protein